MPNLTLVPASPESLHLVLDLLNASAQWLVSKGIHQWQSPLPATFITFLQDEVRAGRVFLATAEQGDSPVATFRITQQDMPRWRDDGRANALYVYSLAIRDSMHGLGIGAQVLNAIRDMAAQQGRAWLRLDCWARNHRLQAYYASLGFLQAGEVNDDNFPLTLFQVRLSSGERSLA